MAIDRDRAHEVENGIIVASKANLGHLSSALAVPTHTGKEGDYYFDGATGSWWYLASDGSVWTRATAVGIPVFAITLQHQGAVSNGTFYGYAANTPGDQTPVTIFRKARIDHVSFSNSRAGADYDIEFRKNSPTAAVFETISKTNVQNFAQDMVTPTEFAQGDTIYVKHVTTGTDPKDVGILLGLTGLD